MRRRVITLCPGENLPRTLSPALSSRYTGYRVVPHARLSPFGSRAAFLRFSPGSSFARCIPLVSLLSEIFRGDLATQFVFMGFFRKAEGTKDRGRGRRVEYSPLRFFSPFSYGSEASSGARYSVFRYSRGASAWWAGRGRSCTAGKLNGSFMYRGIWPKIRKHASVTVQSPVPIAPTNYCPKLYVSRVRDTAAASAALFLLTVQWSSAAFSAALGRPV